MTPQAAGQVVLKMRDEFLQLVTVYNSVGLYEHAADAQAMAVALHRFECDHDITQMKWPPRLVQLADGPQIAEVER